MITLSTLTPPDACHHPGTFSTPFAGDRDERPEEEEFAVRWFGARGGLLDLTTTAHSASAHRRDTPFSALIVANDRTLRQVITARLERIGAGTVHNAATITEAQACILTTSPGELAIIDLDMLDDTGIELVSELHDHGWPHIVVLATANNPQTIPLTFHAGADAYLLKSSLPATNTTPTNPNTDPYDTPDNELSAREIAVLKLVADGLSNKQIGEKLHLSHFTIKTHLHRIGQKLGTGDRAHMTTLALRAGIIH